MDMRPAPFYQNWNDNGTNRTAVLRDEFIPGIQYVFDVWIDADNVIYNSNNVAAGFTVFYTDGTTDGTFVVTGGSGKGFQHRQLVTNASKSVWFISPYYYVSEPVYYRCDSFICPLANTTTAKKSGIITSSNFTEEDISPTSIRFGKGYVVANEFIEI